MNITTTKDLDKLLILLQKRGVKSFKLGNLELTLGEAPVIQTRKTRVLPTITNTYIPGGINEATQIETEELTGDALLFYSADASN